MLTMALLIERMRRRILRLSQLLFDRGYVSAADVILDTETDADFQLKLYRYTQKNFRAGKIRIHSSKCVLMSNRKAKIVGNWKTGSSIDIDDDARVESLL